MTTLRLHGTLLAAGDDVLTYRLLPFGEPGRTSMGTVTASAGALTIPEDVTSLSANLDHDRKLPAAKFVSVTEDDGGLIASVRPLDTSRGRDLAVEAREGVRTGISVEVDNPVIRAGALLGGTLSGAGFTSDPAFQSAQLVACDCGDAETPEGDVPEDETVDETEKEGIVPEPTAVTETAPLTAAAAPLGLPAAPPNQRVATVDEAARLMASATLSGNGGDLVARLTAATGDITTTNAADAIQPTWLGEVWSQRTHRQKFVNLFASAPLTGLKAVGWRFVDGKVPGVADYAGFPAAPNTQDVDTEAVEVLAQRFAGANKVDRANFDFSNPAFWAGYWREQGNSVSRKVDGGGLTHMLTAANYTAATGTAITTTSKAKLILSAVVDGIVAVQDRSVPDFALIPLSAWRDLLLLTRDEAFAYINISLGLDPEDGTLADRFRFVPTSNTTIETGTGAKKVLVGASEAHTHYGEKTVRAETVNIGDGSVSVGLFGYDAFLTADPKSFVLVTVDDGV